MNDPGEQPEPPAPRTPGSVPVDDSRQPRSDRVSSRAVIVSDGSGLRQRAGRRLEFVEPALRVFASVIQELGGPDTQVLLMPARDADQLAAGMRVLPPHVGAAIYLTHTDAARGKAAQQKTGEAGTPPVVTEQDLTAIAVTAELLTTLMRADRTPAHVRVMIAGVDTVPNLGPLLMAAGCHDITFWKQADATAFPLERVAQEADVVIDLLEGAANPIGVMNDAAPAIIAPTQPCSSILALPGLLNAIIENPTPKVDIDVYLACALALSTATPPDRVLPTPEPALTDRVAWAAGQAMRNPRST